MVEFARWESGVERSCRASVQGRFAGWAATSSPSPRVRLRPFSGVNGLRLSTGAEAVGWAMAGTADGAAGGPAGTAARGAAGEAAGGARGDAAGCLADCAASKSARSFAMRAATLGRGFLKTIWLFRIVRTRVPLNFSTTQYSIPGSRNSARRRAPLFASRSTRNARHSASRKAVLAFSFVADGHSAILVLGDAWMIVHVPDKMGCDIGLPVAAAAWRSAASVFAIYAMKRCTVSRATAMGIRGSGVVPCIS